MTNAKAEFLEHVQGQQVICAEIQKGYYEPSSVAVLRLGYSNEDYLEFLDKLDFFYDDGYGGQELYGTIWYADGTWSSRGEYDGSEWWEHNVCPDILDNLKEIV
jgi:hypothetical protein